MLITEINVVLSNNGYKLNYYVFNENGTAEYYTEQTVPHNIIRLINRYNPVRTIETETDKTFLYRF